MTGRVIEAAVVGVDDRGAAFIAVPAVEGLPTFERVGSEAGSIYLVDETGDRWALDCVDTGEVGQVLSSGVILLMTVDTANAQSEPSQTILQVDRPVSGLRP